MKLRDFDNINKSTVTQYTIMRGNADVEEVVDFFDVDYNAEFEVFDRGIQKLMKYLDAVVIEFHTFNDVVRVTVLK